MYMLAESGQESATMTHGLYYIMG